MNNQELDHIKEYVFSKFNNCLAVRHNLDHVMRVVQYSELIYAQLDAKELLDINIIRANALLHDLAFTEYPETFKTQILERRYISQILRRDLPRFSIAQQEKTIIFESCRNHPYSFPYRRLNRKNSFYTQILQDADTIDVFHPERVADYKEKSRVPKFLIKYYLLRKDTHTEDYFNLAISVDIYKKVCKESI